MPRRRKAKPSLQTPPRSYLPDTPPYTPPQTRVVNRIGGFRSPWEAEPPYSFQVNVLRAVSENTQVHSSSSLISARYRKCIRYVYLVLYISIRVFMNCCCNCRSLCHRSCWILLYPHIVIATFRRYPPLRRSILASQALILIILVSLLIEYDRVVRVCYGTIVGVRKLGELCYAAPQAISDLVEACYQGKPFYYILRLLIRLLATALRRIGYLIGRSKLYRYIKPRRNQETA